MFLVGLADPVHQLSVTKQHACCHRYSPMDISKAAKMLQVSVSQCLPLLCLHSCLETATPAGWHCAGHLFAALRSPHSFSPPVQGGEHALQSAPASVYIYPLLASTSRPSAHPCDGCCSQPPIAGNCSPLMRRSTSTSTAWAPCVCPRSSSGLRSLMRMLPTAQGGSRPLSCWLLSLSCSVRPRC